MEPRVRLLVGLGNAKPAYNKTRHNIGRELIDFLQVQSKQSFDKSRQAEIVRLPAFFCAKLMCFMNESGPALKKMLEREKISIQETVIAVDDFMIPFGTLRLRKKGSAGGHNGLKSIIETFGTEEFGRLRMGVGPVPEGEDPADFVLNRFTKTEQKKLPDIFNASQKSIEILVEENHEKSMAFTNRNHLDSR